MPTTMSVYEAKSNFSSVLSDVEANRAVVTIVRYGHPVAQIVPMKAKSVRSLAPDPKLAGKIKVNCDLFADDSGMWEACDETPAP